MSRQSDKQALKNLFEDNSVKTSYGQIQSRISSKKFRVKDDLGNTVIANADREWGIGTYVRMQDNFIVDTGKPSGTLKVFRV